MRQKYNDRIFLYEINLENLSQREDFFKSSVSDLSTAF